ncbi:hypothetical protein J31TS4_25880 [Paenibacillus sp. J31TS4]|uniref:nucleotidyltransferase domain-containing protein n=1 Tax=Paenibacillus sp. J31TS4 TaxID=2807195 RepID=UPI001B0672F7|nr:nucleotidyltransferase domain-containing protein [Paenibacillus sp. J31TS4]GIP39308.1 hypothetical protein J31TS4_25880 [Paenibacillus sp. J31TS4]
MEVQHTIERAVNTLRQVRGVEAVVLGGSRARGTHGVHSDVDIGIYYDPHIGLDLQALREASACLDDARRADAVTEPGEWGPWINGGGWLTVDGRPMDWLYRDLNKVAEVLEQCLAGIVTMDYQPGHPHGFVNAVYMAEIALCQMLWEREGRVEALKQKTAPYPPQLRKALVDKFGWEASFAWEAGKKGAAKGDLAYVAGCWFRSVSCMNQVLFALNGCYWMNEKGALALADSFPIAPTQYRERIEGPLSLLGTGPSGLSRFLSLWEELLRETDGLAARAE